ncbi:MAG: DMT family transporter [Gammaproteobacteria bacterium]|nr:DMT family transporter [Gammaproteobacteria bacterium]
MITPPPGIVVSNLTCFSAMVMWSVAFPIAEFMLHSWGTIALVLVRQLIAVSALFLVWLYIDGLTRIRSADWLAGIRVGGVGFGLGSMTFLVGQSMSDAVTPAIAASMMPIIGALLEVTLDGRRLRPRLVSGIVFALLGGLLATGTRLGEGNFGWGSLLCLFSVVLFAWATRATNHGFRSLSYVGQTTITLSGSLLVVSSVYLLLLLLDLPGTAIGSYESHHVLLLVFSSTCSLALAQFMWIRGAAGLGILLASLHMNAVPFYVMVIVALFLGESWNWGQAAGAVLVAIGVLLAQPASRQ